MTVETNVRPADRSVATFCEAIDLSARSSLVGRRGGDAWLAEHPELSTIENWWSHSFVASVDGVPVGFLYGRVDDGRRGRIFHVDRVYVIDDARELGLGDDLLAAALVLAEELGCSCLEGVALPGDRETKNLYERAGVVARSITVSRRISAPSSSEDASR